MGSLQAAKVGFLVVATGKYIQFVEPLLTSARQHFCKGHDVTYFVFTDSDFPAAEDVIVRFHPKMGWPYDTLLRYEAFDRIADLLCKQDYLFASDADMLFCGDVGEEMFSKRVATQHPGFDPSSPFPRKRGSYETDPDSTACVYDHEGTHYFAGGFYGGEAKEVLQAVKTILKRIYQDLEKGIIAEHHDESQWNRYCIDYPPTLILNPSYCYPESWDLPYPKKLLALDKEHDEIR
ncbi:MAG: hypothetical protein HY324_00850 [Chlamydiia bacterium]|nr:hypothetical protein [Chlamydiia bacterium]